MGRCYPHLSLEDRRKIAKWFDAKSQTVSAKNGYKKTGRCPPGAPSKMEAYYERRRVERAAEASNKV